LANFVLHGAVFVSSAATDVSTSTRQRPPVASSSAFCAARAQPVQDMPAMESVVR